MKLKVITEIDTESFDYEQYIDDEIVKSIKSGVRAAIKDHPKVKDYIDAKADALIAEMVRRDLG